MGNSSETEQDSLPGVNWSLEEATEFIAACYDRDTILDVLMGYSAHWFPARMTLIVGRAWVQLFAADGFDLPMQLPRELRRADVDPDADAVTAPIATGTAEEVGLATLFQQLELGDPLLRTVGVTIGERVAIVLLGTVRTEEVDTSNLVTATEIAGTQLEAVIRMAKADELPPTDQRIPAFPAPKSAHEAKTKLAKSPLAEQGRRTQQLEVGAGGSDPASTISTPRLATVSADEEQEVDESQEDPQLSPNATSFGLPFAKEGAKEPKEPSENGEESEATPETIIGSPFNDEKFPGEIGDDDSGVSTVSPTRLDGDDASRTQLGGLAAQAGLISKRLSERDEPDEADEKPSAVEAKSKAAAGPGTVAGTPSNFDKTPTSDSVTRTALGGLEGETRLVSEALSKGRTASDKESDEKSGQRQGEQEQSKSSSDQEQGSWINARTKDGVPGAMILKPARKRKSESGNTSKLPAGARSPSGAGNQKPTRDERSTPVRTSKITPVAPDRNSAESRSDAGDDSMFPMKPSRPVTGGTFDRERGKTRRFGGDDVDDAWFDYFADNTENQSPNIEAAIDFDLSEVSEEPNSLPPETLERLLDSGPEMVDMQEAFLILDSRDQTMAFEAAEEVAELGDTALEVLDLMFPGRIFLDRYQFADNLPPVNEHGPVLHALVRIGDRTIGIARKHMRDSSNETRFYAVFLLTRLNAEPALPDLFERLFDRDQQIRKVAADIVIGYQNTDPFIQHIQRPLRNELLSGEDLHVTIAANLLARLKDVSAIVPLIDAMDSTTAARVRTVVLDALTTISLQNHTAPYEWRQWWQKAQDQDRSDWLVAALDAESSEIRKLAFNEVQRFPGLELNYHPEQPSKLRKRAQTDLRQWLDARDGA